MDIKPLWACAVLGLIFMSHTPVAASAQSPSTQDISSKPTSGNGSSVVSVRSTVSVEVSNDTVKIKEGMLRNAVISFLNSGPNVLKTSDNSESIIKTKITNQVNKDTQSVEGAEATYAIIGVEIGKVLKSLISSLTQPNQTRNVAIDTSSTCKPSSANVISCENNITIK